MVNCFKNPFYRKKIFIYLWFTSKKNYSQMKTKLFLQLIFFALIVSTMYFNQLMAQPIQPRLNQGAVLEPQGKIINGAGQDQTGYMNYWNVMHANDKPLIYMTYIGLRDLTSDWANGLKAYLMLNGKFQIPQIGLSMTVDGTPSTHYEQDVAAGLYDKQITMFIDGLQSLAIPAYVRIGYEFNGTAWNGYLPDSYKKAFIRITNMIRSRGVEVATVWNYSVDLGATMDFTKYYPGDEYVDWWSINFFSATHFTDPNTKSFLDSASVHHKPVMLGETTPRSLTVLNGQLTWDQWYSPYFNFIHANPEVKALSYINWDWSQYEQFKTWGDSRLEQNTIIGNNFANEMDSLQYLHASTESAFRKTLGSSDNTAPATPGIVTVTQLGYPLQLNWDAVTDPSGLSHYIVYKHGTLSDYTLTLPYSDKTIAAGDTITYAVSAMDRAGNESGKTAGLRVNVPNSLSKAVNGEFDNGTQSWQLSTYAAGASATLQIDSNSVVSGRYSAKINISQVTGTSWHIQLWQWLPIHRGCQYTITYKAKASSSKTIDLSIQQAASPYTVYLNKTHTLTTKVQTFTDKVSITKTDQAKLEFYIGSAGTVQLWIDSVSIVETLPVSAPTIPVLLSPVNGETNQAVSTTLNWNAATRADSYTLQVSTESDFSSTIINQSGITLTSKEISGLENEITYYWRVRATNTGGNSNWSTTWNFTTKVYEGIDDLGENIPFIIYPNPTEGILTIESNTSDCFVTILSIDGKPKFHKRLNGGVNSFDLSSLSKGIYIIKIENSKGSIIRRLIKK
jgi:hypothetical protein